ncbi:hypothetical protein JX265_002788 [Neoarthrinium moseri]|uniref:rRNA methyltransferase 2, mitochondrial n=1 Tax=Neoarthrinium moseri TaxID=1658444 RepID=A0A9P9WTJ9_9PEZI|nr:hypothetical protein JX265_002788 [Neoarthrinium moseri]
MPAAMGRPAKPATGRDDKVKLDTTEKRTKQLHHLEMRHQHGASKSDLLVKDEDVRRLKLRILLLRDENTTLRDQISQNNDTQAKLAEQCQDLSAQLEAKIQLVQSQEQQLRKQEREFSSLKAELQSINNLNEESTNMLAEKLALGRELAVLKPELEHLRSQLTHQQATLAEKLALERQVNTLEVELANEKKATKRAMQKRESTDRVEDDLRKKIREAEKQLAAEKAQRERLEDQLAQEKRTHQLALQDQDSTRDLESDLRKKLQDAQKELRESTADKERLEQELEAEKRQAKRYQKKQQSESAEEDDELRGKLDEAETKLAAAQKEAHKVRTEAQTSVADADARSEAFEKKFEKLKAKFRDLQDQLKQCQADLRKAQQGQQAKPSVAASLPSLADEVAKKTAARQAFKKRKAQEIAKDDFTQITIDTPSADDRPRKNFKKKLAEPTMPGEKSTFSITPFLNRSKTGSDDNQEDDDEEVHDSILGHRERPKTKKTVGFATTTEPIVFTGGDASSSSPAASEPPSTEAAEEEKPQAQPKPRGRPKKVLADAPSAKKNAQPLPKTALKKTAKPAPSLDKVAEEGQENAPKPAEKTQPLKFNYTMPQDTSTSSANTSKGEETKKKKRKVLGAKKTLFDDEDEAEDIPVRKPAPVAASGKRAKAPLGGVRNAFAGASFSPLKRERRGVGASFLANAGRRVIAIPQEEDCMRSLLTLASPRNGGFLRPSASSAALWKHLSSSPLTSSERPCIAAATALRWSSSNSRWKQRQGNDFYAREAKVQGLKSRAAFKLLEMDSKYKIFKRGQTVIDLGYAPGSWSQVAQERTKPNGRIVGIDLIPAQPPKGVSTIQGNFLSPQVQALVKEYLQEFAARKPATRPRSTVGSSDNADVDPEDVANLIRQASYIDAERAETAEHPLEDPHDAGRLVDVVLSDMSAPWSQTSGFSSNTLSNPYHRMMNTSGMSFRDHAGSMDLCMAALQFASDTLKTGGHFLCKFYQGSEDKEMEQKLKKMFGRVHREKPESSRTESREAYFVALRRKGDVTLEDITK